MTWKLTYDEWIPEEQPLREALTTLGNGYFATRGACEEAVAGGPHYPGTYLAGGYDRLVSDVSGRDVENEDLVNWPNWLCLDYRVVDEAAADDPHGGWNALERSEVLEHRHELDLRRGVLRRRTRFRDAAGRTSTVESRRLVSQADPHLAAIAWRLVPEDWQGRVEVRSSLDGRVENNGVARYRALRGDHLVPLETGAIDSEGVYLAVRTRQSHIRMAQAARHRVSAGECDERHTVEADDVVGHHLLFDVREGEPIGIEKVVALYTSRDNAISEPLYAARRALEHAGDFTTLEEAHAAAWERLWRRTDIELEGNDRAQLVLRIHVFHLLQTTSPNTTDLDAGVPARGLHGEAYRGHVFWDEIYIFPFLDLSLPELTRALLMYRYRRLDEARRGAREAGYQGAMYPWQSSSDGREESQRLHLNPRSGRWLPDETLLQRHVSSAIAYNVWHHCKSTGDLDYLSTFGAEILVEIARFWASIAEYDEEKKRYVIRGVVGPDEYHTRYPEADEPGLDNNAYTNVMAAWVLRVARQAIDLLGEERRREFLGELHVAEEELKRWDEVARRLFVPFHDGLISQFEGYEKLEEFDWSSYREKYGDIQRLDRILEAEDDSPNHYKVSKQADVLMLLYLFSAEELEELLKSMGYEFDSASIPRLIDYYTQRTSHGSTLSNLVHGWVLARSDRKRSWELFEKSLESDVGDIQGGTTAEGIHLGAMAGTTDMVQRCYLGIRMRDGELWLDPDLPEKIDRLRLRLRYRQQWIRLEADHERLRIFLEKSGRRPPTRLRVAGDEAFEMRPGEEREIVLGA